MDYREGNTVSFKLTEILQKKMRFIALMQQIYGVFMIIGGVLTCLGIITAIIGVPAIISGVKLFQSGSSLNIACRTQSGDEMVATFENMHEYWKFTLITTIIVLCLCALFYAFIIFGLTLAIIEVFYSK